MVQRNDRIRHGDHRYPLLGRRPRTDGILPSPDPTNWDQGDIDLYLDCACCCCFVSPCRVSPFSGEGLISGSLVLLDCTWHGSRGGMSRLLRGTGRSRSIESIRREGRDTSDTLIWTDQSTRCYDRRFHRVDRRFRDEMIGCPHELVMFGSVRTLRYCSNGRSIYRDTFILACLDCMTRGACERCAGRFTLSDPR